MARRRKKKGRRKGKTAIPLAQTMTLGYPIYTAFEQKGLTAAAANTALYNISGFDASTGRMLDYNKGILMAVVLIAESTIGRKVANKTGANRMVKKLSGGYLQLF